MLRIGIAGAGAVGCHYGSLLQQAGYDVVFCTRGFHLRQLQKKGLHHETVDQDVLLRVCASDDYASLKDVDLIFLTCKMTGLAFFLAQLKSYIQPHCMLITMQNGVVAPDLVAQYFPTHPIVAVSAFIGVRMPEYAHVVHSTAGHLILGSWLNVKNEQLDLLCGVLERASVPYAVKQDMPTVLWRKMLWNCGFNAFSALTKRYAKDLAKHDVYAALVRQAMLETLAVARALHIDLNESHIDNHLTQTAQAGLIQSSMWQDIVAGKTTEIHFLNGYIVRKAKELGLGAEVNAYLSTLIDALQSRTL